MEVRGMGKRSTVRLLRTRALWVCVLTGLIAIAAASRPGARTISAQSTEPQTVAPQTAANAPSGANAQVAQPDRAAKHESDNASADPRQKQIAEETANLLKLANDLKAEVDKTTPDTMSVSVIRHAEEIEKLAHKMRSK
jgi:hypothetical protein